MAEAESASSQGQGKRSGRFRWLRWIDDAIFAAEQAVVSSFLIAITVMVFLDVVYRRLAAPDSKVGQLVARIGGIEDPQARAFLDQTLAPWIGAVLGILLLWFAFWTAERHKKSPLLPIKQGPLVLALLAAAAVVGLGWMMLHLESWIVYLILYVLAAGAYGAALLRRRPDGWRLRVGVMLGVVTPLFVYSALTWFPRGYSWSKEMSLMMLLWVGFLGASVCAHEGKHLRMEAFEKLLTPAMARWVRVAGFLATAGFSGLLAWLGYLYLFTPVTGAFYLGGLFEQTQIPDWIATIAVPIAFGMTMIRFIAAAISSALGGHYGAPPTEATLAEAEKAKAEMLGAPLDEEAKS